MFGMPMSANTMSKEFLSNNPRASAPSCASVTIAHDGAEALGLFDRNSFDIVFADIGMPNMDGYEFAARVRELADGKDVPLVAMTGFTRPYDVQRASSAGFDAHLGKPLTMDALTTTMQRVRAAKV